MPEGIQCPKAQSISEYVILIGIVALALIGMQVYMRRGIQAVVKTAADQIGDQKKGGTEYDYRYEWKEKREANTTAATTGTQNIITSEGGAVTHVKNENTAYSGTLFEGVQKEKE